VPALVFPVGAARRAWPGHRAGNRAELFSMPGALGVLNPSVDVILVTYGQLATPGLLGLTFRCAGAMLPCNREHQGGV
jgi:hypothetical protein